MNNRSGLDRVASIVFALSAVVIAGTVVYRTISNPDDLPRVVASGPVRVSEAAWQASVSEGRLLAGSRTAPITMVEYADLECPACRGFQATLDEVLGARPEAVRLLYVPYPLPYHRFAVPAANAAECAEQANALGSWVRALYRKQDSLGLKSWGSFAADAGIADTAVVALCAMRNGPAPRVRKGIEIGAAAGVAGTPTLLIDGWRFSEPPSAAQLDHLIDSLLASAAPSETRRHLLAGQVVDSATNAPLRGANISVVDTAGNAAYQATTDSTGDFEARVVAGRYRLHVEKPGYTTFASRWFDFHADLPTHVIFLARAQGGNPSSGTVMP